ncbi:MAG: nitroreductase/quinone reductase family protein [Acidimicrobiales bacterium]
MPLPPFVKDVGFRALNKTHRAILHLSRGRVGASAFGMPAVELFTVGRRSGRTISTMLTSPVVDGEKVILVASKGGDDRDPDWYRNLKAHPDVDVTMRGRRRPMSARVASEEEAAELWPHIVAAYKPYGSYRRRTSRQIPLVICEPR